MTTLKVMKLYEAARLPERATSGSAGLDIFAFPPTPIVLKSGGPVVMVPTGLILEVPLGWHCQMHGRSSLAANGVMVFPGVIDEDYRGPLHVIMYCLSGHTDWEVRDYDRVAQLVLTQIQFGPTTSPSLKVLEVKEVSETERGIGGLGSTGR